MTTLSKVDKQTRQLFIPNRSAYVSALHD